ncbi:MAG: hypothetical protein U0640_11165 [Phycisphaerales bacterium]
MSHALAAAGRLSSRFGHVVLVLVLVVLGGFKRGLAASKQPGGRGTGHDGTGVRKFLKGGGEVVPAGVRIAANGQGGRAVAGQFLGDLDARPGLHQLANEGVA